MEQPSSSKSWFSSAFPQAQCESLLGHVSFHCSLPRVLIIQPGCKLTNADRTPIPLVIIVFSLPNVVCLEAGRSNGTEKNFQQGM